MKVKYLGIYLFAFFMPLPLPMKYNGMALIAMLINLLLLLNNEKIKNFRTTIHNPLVIIFLLFFLTDFLRALITFDFNQTNYREVKLIFILFPIFAVVHKTMFEKQFKHIIKFFCFGVITYIVSAWSFVFYYYNIQYPAYIFDFTDHFVVYVLANEFPLALHHTYIGLYIMITALIIFSETILRKKIQPVKGLGLSVFLLFNSFFIGGKGTSALLIVFMMAIFVKQIVNKTTFKFFKLYAIGFFLTVVFGIYAIYEWLSISIGQSLGFRKTIYRRSLESISEALPFGIGKSGLNNIPLDVANPSGKNLITHNIYFNELIMNGILGEIILLSMLFYLCYVAYRNGLIFLLFMLSIMLIGLTEDVLSRQRGILFFVFFASILYAKYVNNTNTRHQAQNE